MEVQKAHKVTIETLVGCRLNDSDVWIPKTKMIGNTKVMLLSKWDRGLTRFMTGKCLDFRASGIKSLNCTAAGAYLDDLCRKRKAACENAVISAHSTDDDNCTGRPKRRKVTLSDSMSHLSPLVDISLPEVVDPPMPTRIVQVAFGTGPEIWLEVNETSLLQVIRGCCECTMSKGRTRKNSKAETSATDSTETVLDSPREPDALACEKAHSHEVKCEVESLQQEVESMEGNSNGDDAYDATLVDDQHLDTQPYGEHLEILKRQNAKVWNEHAQ